MDKVRISSNGRFSLVRVIALSFLQFFGNLGLATVTTSACKKQAQNIIPEVCLHRQDRNEWNDTELGSSVQSQQCEQALKAFRPKLE